MKRIVVFCDGTWGRLSHPSPNNVVKLSEAVLSTATNGTPQLIYYDEGVGTLSESLFSKAANAVSGAFGVGLMRNVEQAYRFLVFNYEPGDEIYLFGFSRGAFTARSLAGLIRNCGIVVQDQAHNAHKAIEVYRSRDPDLHPNEDGAFEFRLKYAPHVYFNDKELKWRKTQPMDFDPERSALLRIHYVGVWDTVGALGIPHSFTSLRWFNKKYEFHDMELSRAVASGRHAVAIDERRVDHTPALWSNLDDLNRGADPPSAPYQQLWFPGDHSGVGGGGEVVGLAAAALEWVVAGAEEVGLELYQATLHEYRQEIDHLAEPPSHGQPHWIYQLADRDGPADLKQVSDVARRRWRDDPTYRPETLRQVRDAL